MAASANDKQKQAAVLVVVVVLVAVVFGRNLLFGKKTGKDNVRGDGGGAVAGGGGGGGNEAAPAAPTVTPTMIPVLGPEIKEKIAKRHASTEQGYTKEKLEVGINPFIPLGADITQVEEHASQVASSSGGGSKKKQGFAKKLTFWGAFLPGPDEPKRVIIEVGGDPQPWTGAVGEMIEGTPYRVEKLYDGDQKVMLKNPTNDRDKPVVLEFEGAKDEGGGRSGGSSDRDVDELFGGKKPVEPGASPAAGAPKAAASPAAAGKGSLEPAFDR